MSDYEVEELLDIIGSVQRAADSPTELNGRFPLTLSIQCASKPKLLPLITAQLEKLDRGFTVEGDEIRVWG